MLYLRQASGTGAASGPTLSIGPVLDSTGAEYTGLAIGDLTLAKNGTESALAANATLTHSSNGHYLLVCIGNNADTIGRGQIRCNKSGYQFCPLEFEVLHANVYDVLFGSTAPSTHTAAQVATALLTDLLNSTDFNTAASFGKLIKDNLDAAISSRNATAPDNSGIASAASAAASAATSSAAAASSAASANTKAADIQTRIPAALVGGKMDAVAAATFSDEDKADIAADLAETVVESLTSLPLRLNSPFAAGGIMTVFAGDDYNDDSGTSLDVTISGWSAFTGYTATLKLLSGESIEATTTVTTGDEVLHFEFTAAQTETLTAADVGDKERGTYQLEITDGSGRVSTKTEGVLYVKAKVS